MLQYSVIKTNCTILYFTVWGKMKIKITAEIFLRRHKLHATKADSWHCISTQRKHSVYQFAKLQVKLVPQMLQQISFSFSLFSNCCTFSALVEMFFSQQDYHHTFPHASQVRMLLVQKKTFPLSLFS